MKVFVNGIRSYAYHGAMEQEEHVGGWYTVDIEVELPDERASHTDELSHTVNYAELSRLAVEEMKVRSRLVEHVAGRIARRLKAEWPVLGRIRVSVCKEHPPITGLQCNGAGVTIELS